MHPELTALAATAATIGVLHTVAGPDHYLPFVVLARARRWSTGKTAAITALCGLGHVGSSILIGAIGIVFGLGLAKLKVFEGLRGGLAAWAFILFGLAYFIWGLARGLKNRGHHHLHVHADGTVHADHPPRGGADGVVAGHMHAEPKSVNMTPWILFTIFVFGPCEPLIPLLMFPAAKLNPGGVVLVAAVFSLATIATMEAMVLLPAAGLKWLPMRFLERYMHAVAGFTIFACGVGMAFFGL
jgi:nickel/cobalt transporter (NicO) family protein